MSKHSQLADRVVGCLLAGAIGDAAGSRYEGEPPPIAVDFEDEWFITDDTQLTLATCTAIVAQGEVNAESIAAEFARAFRSRTLVGLGASTYQALEALAAGGHWALAGRKGDRAAGNGAAMRAAPLAFCLDLSSHADRRVFRDVCRITHHNDEAYVGALAIALAVQFAWRGEWRGGPGLIPQVGRQLPDSGVCDRLRDMEALEPNTTLHEVARQFGNSGWAVESVPLALYSVQHLHEDGFTGWLRSVVELGGDCDTIASMAAQIAGCWLGGQRVPSNLIEKIPEGALVRNSAAAFATYISARG